MRQILVSGLINVETTIQVDGFPITYTPVRYPFFGINSRVSGVGYNVVKALHTLGDDVRFMSLIGADPAGRLVQEALSSDGIAGEFVIQAMPYTAQSAILYDATGKRMIHTDLKDIQERAYPAELFEQAVNGCSLAVLCNINFSRPFLSRARQRGLPIATDVHAIADLEDSYNRDFMAAADILFMSDECLPCPPEEWVRGVWRRYGPEIAVVGLGSQGVLLGVRSERFLERVPAVRTRPVVSTIGAGDALFSAFVHFYSRTHDPHGAIRRAVVFASYKIGEASAAEGFLDEDALERLCVQAAYHR